MSNELNFEVRGHVAYVQLNRPHVLNALSSGLERELARCWDEIDADPEIRVAVLSGAGEKAFCSGGDLNNDPSSDSERLAFGGGLTGMGGPLRVLQKPLIAAVHGYCLGGGFELAMCADLIVAADTAQFGLPEVRIGLISDSGMLHRAVRQLPFRVAMAMILSDARLDAHQALQYGLVNEVVPYEGLSAAAEEWAEKLSVCSPLAQQAAKHAAMEGLGFSLDDALARRYEPIESYARSADMQEGWDAFAERRPPKWSGR